MYSGLFILNDLPHRVHNHSAQLAAFFGGVELPNKALKTFFCTAGLINWSLVRDARFVTLAAKSRVESKKALLAGGFSH